jgi:hypothetical protein
MNRTETALAELNGLVENAQHVLAEYLPPNSGISEHEAISRLLGLLDGPQQRRIQGNARELLGARPALFSAH